MSGRPEGNDGEYGWIEPYDAEAWQEFTPWRPGDKSASGQEGIQEAASGTDDGRRWWTEPQPDEFGVGDRVRSTRPVGGVLGGAVPSGMIGEVVSTRLGMFGESLTVRFENGYTEEVEPSMIKYEGWF
jgi:hypothetical protein